MNDREYLKLNTSIQTGSNAETLLHDEEGNTEATVELRLPDNIFKSSGPKKIDGVEMLVSKFRLSLENTPIAQLPLDVELSDAEKVISKCQLDVYPYSYDDGVLKPTPNTPGSELSLENYKNHEVEYQIILADFSDPDFPNYNTVEVYSGKANTPNYGFPTDSPFYPIAKQTNSLDVEKHLMNLCVQTSHGNYSLDDTSVYINSVGTLEQMLQDALENAVTYAMTADKEVVCIYLLDTTSIPSTIDPKPNTDLVVDVGGTMYCYWKTEHSTDESEISCALHAAFKPRVQIGAQTISISYDSAAFNEIIPIIWNTAYVDTYETPEQMTLDVFRNLIWSKPPPKRVYKYNAAIDENDQSYAYSVIESLKCLVMNIIGNKAMRDTFSFLPWIPINTKTMDYFKDGGDVTTYRVRIDNIYTAARKKTDRKIYNTETFNLMLGNVTLPAATQYSITGWYSLTYPTAIIQDINENLYNGEYPGIFYVYFLADRNGADTDVSLRLHKILYLNESETFYRQIKQPGEFVPLETTGEWESTTLPSNVEVEDYLTTNTETPGVSVLNTDTTTTSSTDTTTWNNAFVNFRLHYDQSWYIPGEDQGSSDWDGASTAHLVSVNRVPSQDPTEMTVINLSDYEGYESDPACIIIKFWGVDNSDIGHPIDTMGYSSTHSQYEAIPFADEFKTTEEDTYNVTKTVTIESVAPGEESVVYQDVVPNLDLSDNKFYILDGTNAMVTVGGQELIRTYDSAYTYHVTETTSVTSKKKYGYRYTYLANERATVVNDQFVPPQVSWHAYQMSGVEQSTSPHNSGFYLYHAECPLGLSPPPSAENWVQVMHYVDDWHGQDGSYQEIRSGNIIRQDLNNHDVPIMQELFISGTDQPTPPDEVNEYDSNDPSLTPGTTTTTTSETTFSNMTGGLVTERTGTWLNTRTYGLIPMISYAELSSFRNPSAAWLPTDQHPPDFYRVWDAPQSMILGYVIEFGWYLKTDDYNLRQSGNTINQVTNENRYYFATTTTKTTEITENQSDYGGNVRITFTWDNLPMVVMSPIQSIVMTLTGIGFNEQIQPINISDRKGSTLTATVPIVENYYSMAATLRDLHDELVISKDTFDDAPCYSLVPTSGQERVLKLSAKYITKDGKLHQIFIPPNGVFSIQLIFGLSFYMSS